MGRNHGSLEETWLGGLWRPVLKVWPSEPGALWDCGIYMRRPLCSWAAFAGQNLMNWHQPCSLAQLRGLWGKGVFAQVLRVLPLSAFPLLLVCPLEPPVWLRKAPRGQSQLMKEPGLDAQGTSPTLPVCLTHFDLNCLSWGKEMRIPCHQPPPPHWQLPLGEVTSCSPKPVLLWSLWSRYHWVYTEPVVGRTKFRLCLQAGHTSSHVVWTIRDATSPVLSWKLLEQAHITCGVF